MGNLPFSCEGFRLYLFQKGMIRIQRPQLFHQAIVYPVIHKRIAGTIGLVIPSQCFHKGRDIVHGYFWG